MIHPSLKLPTSAIYYGVQLLITAPSPGESESLGTDNCTHTTVKARSYNGDTLLLRFAIYPAMYKVRSGDVTKCVPLIPECLSAAYKRRHPCRVHIASCTLEPLCLQLGSLIGCLFVRSYGVCDFERRASALLTGLLQPSRFMSYVVLHPNRIVDSLCLSLCLSAPCVSASLSVRTLITEDSLICHTTD